MKFLAKDSVSLLHKRHKKLALVTTSSHSQIDLLLKKHAMLKLFEIVVCREDTNNIKPHPEPLQLALSLLGADPQKAIIVGDSSSDLKAARSAGIDSILFYPKSHRIFHDLNKLNDLQPAFVIQNLKTILDIV